MHHGILGMHWGIRRFQTESGKLTPEGRARYRNDAKFKEKWDRMKRSDEIAKTGVSKSVAKLAAKYEQKGMKPEEALYTASKNVETTKKILAVAGTVTVAAATVAVTAATNPAAIPSVVAKVAPSVAFKSVVDMASSGRLKPSATYDPNSVSTATMDAAEKFAHDLQKGFGESAWKETVGSLNREQAAAVSEWIIKQVS